MYLPVRGTIYGQSGRGVFDVTPYLDRGIFTELKDYSYFKRARIEYGTIVWPNEQDFSPETIELRIEEIAIRMGKSG